jgi:hypothetical protein
MPNDDLVVSDPWVDLRDGIDEARLRETLAVELRREVKAGHVLADQSWEVLARCTHCDEVLLSVGRRWALVHLTYATDERPPWPTTTFFDQLLDVGAAASLHGD